MNTTILHRGVRLLAGLGCSLLLALPAHADTEYQSNDDFLREVFTTPPQAQVLWLDAGIQAKLQPILGHPYRQARLRYWRANGKTAWILDEIGKEYPITAAFVVHDGKIDSARVLVYRESRGAEVHLPGFLHQFQGNSLNGDKLNTPIDGIAGATLSAQAMEHMGRVALLLTQLAP